MRSLYTATPKSSAPRAPPAPPAPPPASPSPSSRPGSRQPSTSAAGDTEKKTVKRTTSATILAQTRAGGSTATPAPQRTRTPLRTRDRNVPPSTTRRLAPGMRNPKLLSTTMPLDKDLTSSRKPPLPALAKAANRAPITPKIATRPAPPQHQTVTLATPLPRRAPRPDAAPSSHNATNNTGSPRDSFVSPVSSFLNTHVTPRSGSRQSRVDSSNTTPNGTPVLETSDAWETRSGLGISPSGLDERLRQAAAFGPSTPPIQASADTKFFYASDAKVPQQPAPIRPLSSQQKASTFFYANGSGIPDRQAAPPRAFSPAPRAASPAPDPLASKFVYANGATEVPQPLPLKPAFSPSAPASTVSTTSKAPSRPTTAAPSIVGRPSPRPASPLKLPSYPSSSNAHALGANRAAMASAPQLGPTGSAIRGTSSVAPSGRPSHARNGSFTIADPPTVARILSSHPTSETSSPVPPTPAAGLASILQAADELEESGEGRPCSELHSPTKSSHPQDQLDDLVVNARRERKVQDLEITNASLEAINRSLERQLRKQKTELRQFRRLSRSGRLSLASTRIVSTSTLEGPLEDPDRMLADLSEEDSEPDEDEFDESDMSGSESTAASSGLSPSTIALRDAMHRKKDEKRLRLDLSKHQQLLIDSQKMNQSLKRCLGWTEELIREGKKALEFQVRVSEVEMGGRVLAPPDEDEEDDMSSVYRPGDDTIRLAVDGEGVLSEGDKRPQDRDSGVDIPAGLRLDGG